jgi:hypothetical protein
MHPSPHRTATAASLLALSLGIACSSGTAPPTPVPTTVAISPTAVQFDAIGSTRQLTATVRDQNGVAMSGVTVTWSSANPGAADVSTSGLVTAVANGTTEITATAGSATGRVTVTVTLSTSQYNIVLRYITAPDAAYQNAFTAAKDRWESVISGDVPSVPLLSQANLSCGGVTIAPALDETVDDIIIYVDLQPIDGEGNIVGSAGPCYVRSLTGLPLLGGMKFDTDDLAYLNARGLLDETIAHEMGHVLGFGTLWTFPAIDLLRNPSDTADGGTLGADTHFIGVQALGAFDDVGGAGYVGAKVPVENDDAEYGSGSLDSHWRESVFGTELMTPTLNAGQGIDNLVSKVTVASMGDLGYTVNLAAADTYVLPGSAAVAAADGQPAVDLGDDVARGPVFVVDSGGRVVGRIRR